MLQCPSPLSSHCKRTAHSRSMLAPKSPLLLETEEAAAIPDNSDHKYYVVGATITAAGQTSPSLESMIVTTNMLIRCNNPSSVFDFLVASTSCSFAVCPKIVINTETGSLAFWISNLDATNPTDCCVIQCGRGFRGKYDFTATSRA